LGRIIGRNQESRLDLMPSDESSFNCSATKYCRYAISRRKINYLGHTTL